MLNFDIYLTYYIWKYIRGGGKLLKIKRF